MFYVSISHLETIWAPDLVHPHICSETYVQAFPLTIQTQLQAVYFENEYWKENSNGLIIVKKKKKKNQTNQPHLQKLSIYLYMCVNMCVYIAIGRKDLPAI